MGFGVGVGMRKKSEFITYPYLCIRSKPLPLGDGKHTLFHTLMWIHFQLALKMNEKNLDHYPMETTALISTIIRHTWTRKVFIRELKLTFLYLVMTFMLIFSFFVYGRRWLTLKKHCYERKYIYIYTLLSIYVLPFFPNSYKDVRHKYLIHCLGLSTSWKELFGISFGLGALEKFTETGGALYTEKVWKPLA